MAHLTEPVLRRKDEKRALGWHWFVVVDAVGQGRSGFVAGPVMHVVLGSPEVTHGPMALRGL